MDDLVPSSVEHSPHYSDNNQSWTWNQQANEDFESFADCSHELSGLMEDKEIAARAVAFVVNSTRKGIVPLCANVANLMRSKQCLERKLHMMKRENNAYRSSLSAGSVPSQSMSPTAPSLSSYTEQCIKSLQEESLSIQDPFRSSSRCSNSSSTFSYSPNMEKTRGTCYSYSPRFDKPRGSSLRLSSLQYSPASSNDSNKRASARSMHSSLSAFRESQSRAHTRDNAQRLIAEKASPAAKPEISGDGGVGNNTLFEVTENLTHLIEVFKIDDDKKYTTKQRNTNIHLGDSQAVSAPVTWSIEDETKQDSKHKVTSNAIINGKDITSLECTKTVDKGTEEKQTLLERRRVSLPEINTLPYLKAIKIRPKRSKKIQCSLDKIERNNDQPLDKPDRSNDQSLEEQFVKSVKLNAKLEEELCEARSEIDHLRRRLRRMEAAGAISKTSDSANDEKGVEDNGYYTGSNRTSRTGSEHEKTNLFKKSNTKQQTVTSVTYTGPLPNCRCSACQEAIGSDDDLAHYFDVYFDQQHRYAVNKLQVYMDDHVITRGGQTGFIRYIGHLDDSDQRHLLFVGIELETPDGAHDGSYAGKSYFYCRKNCGIFVPLSDVVGKINKKMPVKGFKDESSKGKKYTRKPLQEEIITQF